MVLLLLAATATALATGLGTLPVYALGRRLDGVRPALWGAVAGIMGVASVQGLLLPGLREGSAAEVLGGAAAGVAFMAVARARLRRHDIRVGTLREAGARRAVLIVGVLFVHSLPEGLALGAAWAGGSAALGIYVFLAIALQNIPEGTATAIPLRDGGVSISRAFWTATLTSAPQPVGAAAAYLLVDAARSLLPISFGFAAGAMLAIIVVEVLPVALARPGRGTGVAGIVLAGAAMAAFGLALGVD